VGMLRFTGLVQGWQGRLIESGEVGACSGDADLQAFDFAEPCLCAGGFQIRS
jgi:hypothetical protein